MLKIERMEYPSLGISLVHTRNAEFVPIFKYKRENPHQHNKQGTYYCTTQEKYMKKLESSHLAFNVAGNQWKKDHCDKTMINTRMNKLIQKQV
jgi:hypothetical protein